MLVLDFTLPTAHENLALDEALLEEAEDAGEPREVLRLWEAAEPFVVLGRSSKRATEVDERSCQRLGIPILRRVSGGAAIVTGPGCLMYALVLSYTLRPQLRAIDLAHEHVLDRMARGLRSLVAGVARHGTSDLAWGEPAMKFSGNSLRCKRDHLLYHGTLMYRFPLDLIAQCLRMPPRQPDYRAGRPHGRFVANLPVDPIAVRNAIRQQWDAVDMLAAWPRDLTRQLVEEKYTATQWNG